MTTYICKCGMEVHLSASGATTALKEPYRISPNHLHEYGEDSRLTCEGCPYICQRSDYKGGKTPEARLSKELFYTTEARFQLGTPKVAEVLTLDFDLLQEIDEAASGIPGMGRNRYWEDQSYRCSQYGADGRMRYTIYTDGTKKCIAGKQQLFDAFFNEDGSRKDLTPEQEKEKILTGIVVARKAAQGKKISHYCTEEEGHGCICCTCANDECDGPGDVCCNEHDGCVYVNDMDATCYSRATSCPDYRPEDGVTSCQLSTPDAATAAESPAAEPPAPADAGNTMAGDAAPGNAVTDDAPESDLAMPDTSTPAPVTFDYSGLPERTVDTLHVAERMIRDARKDYIIKVADAVGMAHDELCDTVVAQCDNGKFTKKSETFYAWCASVGLSKDTAYRLLQVSNLMMASTPEEQKMLKEAPATLLYAAAKPSAPPELVAGVKAGDITTNKQYQEALAQIKSLEAQNSTLKRDKDEILQSARNTEKQLNAAENERDGARQALEASKMRADKWRKEAEELRSRPVEVAVQEPDQDAIEQLVNERAEALTEPLRRQIEDMQRSAPDPDAAEQEQHDAFDAVILATRTLQNTWITIKPLLSKLPAPQQIDAAGRLCAKLEEIKKEVAACL